MMTVKKIFSTLTVIIIAGNFCLAQLSIDSLLNSLKNEKNDTAKVNTFNRLSHESGLNGEFDNEMKFATQALDLANKQNWKKGIAVSLQNVASAHDNLGDFSEALKNYFSAYKIYEELKHTQGIAVCLGNIGSVYEIQGDYLLALEYYFKSLKMVEETNDKNRMAITLANIGNVYMEQGDFSKSLGYYFKALKLEEELGRKRGIAADMVNIGNVYYEKGEHEHALDYYLKALKIAEELDEKVYMSVLLGNIGSVYDELGDKEKSLGYFQKALKLNTEMGRKTGISNNLSNIGHLYKKQGKYELALDYYLKSLKIDEESGRKKGLIINYCHIGGLYLAQKKYPLAKEFLQKSINLAKQTGSNIDLSIGYAKMSVLDSAMGNYKDAFINYKIHIDYRDSLTNEESERKTTQIAMQYEFDKKQAADSILVSEERKINTIKFEEEKTQRLYLYVVLGLIVVFALFIYSRFRLSQKQKHIIELKEKETQQQKHIIEEKHKEIKDSINYAERIQRSLLASDQILSENLSSSVEDQLSSEKNYFVYFAPKDIVSGDFYWASKLSNNNFALITADSTGHGVPGAIMSILNIACLNESIKEGCSEPDVILNETRKKVIEVLKRDGSESGGKDGMDCSILVFEPFVNSQKNEVDFSTTLYVSAAYNPVWIVSKLSDGTLQLTEIKADKMPVGKHDKDHVPFTQQRIKLNKGNVVYTLTDGFPDQFGGDKGKKYMIKNLKETLLNMAHLPMNVQHQKLSAEFNAWKGNNEQIDDVTVIGIRI